MTNRIIGHLDPIFSKIMIFSNVANEIIVNYRDMEKTELFWNAIK